MNKKENSLTKEKISDASSTAKVLAHRKRKFHMIFKTFDQSKACFSSICLINKLFLKFYQNKISFRLSRHNVFATYSLFGTNKILKSRSTGVYKIKSSRRKMKFVLPRFLFKFGELLKKQIYTINSGENPCFRSLVFDITARKRYRKRIFKKFRSLKKQNYLLWIVRSKKCFNGCRVSKKRRKKSIKFRIIR
jgi:hypothetical protein